MARNSFVHAAFLAICCGFSLAGSAFHSALLSIESGQRRRRHPENNALRDGRRDERKRFAHRTACSATVSFPCGKHHTKDRAPMATTKKGAERLIKKYPNRRLYDTQTSTYITLADVKQLVMDTEEFKVIDAKSGDELTRSILLQIILDEETGGVPMFSSAMLSQIIRFYGHAMQGMMGTYLEKNIQAFIDIQNKLAENSKGLYSGEAFSPDMWSQFMNMQAPM